MDCPRDDKRSYKYEKAALDSYESLRRSKGFDDLVAYECVCGAWHLGHQVEGISYK